MKDAQVMQKSRVPGVCRQYPDIYLSRHLDRKSDERLKEGVVEATVDSTR